MRHLRVPNQNRGTLSSFKKQIAGILQKIDNFDESDKNEAVKYVRQFIDGNDSSTTQNLEPNTAVDVSIDQNVAKEVVPVTPRRKLKKTQMKVLRKSVIKKSRSRKPKVKPLLKCKECDELKKTKTSLLKHMEVHIGTPISCIVCQRTFNSRASFDWHQLHLCKPKKILSNKRFQCPECPKKFTLQRFLNLHVDGHKRNNCSYCDTVLTRREQLVQHMLDVHKIKLDQSTFSCDYCEKRFVKRQSLYYHLRQHLPGKHVCMECGAVNDTTEDYNEHVKKHDEQKHYQCPRCKDKFSRRQQYICHLKRHDRYKCLTCKENYASKVHAYRHHKRGHLVQGLEPRLHCPSCPAAFHRTLSLQLHIRTHKEDTTTITCKFCDKTFHTPYQYYKHCKTTLHDKNSPEISQLVCENCGKQFIKKYLLEQHLQRFHGGKRSILSCKYCDYRTQFKQNLERHMSLHFCDKKQFMCDHCGKTFTNIGGLTDHIDYIHVQEKQFKCGECDKSFKRNSELVRHQSCHSDARPHVCHLCGQSYKRLNHLRRHEETVHKIVGRSKKVQHLKTDSTGAVVPIPIERKKPKEKKSISKPEMVEPVYSLTNAQVGDYFGTTISVINSITLPKVINAENLIPLTANEFNNQEFWTDKLNLQVEKVSPVVYNTDAASLVSSLPQMSLGPNESDLQDFNMVDQLVKSLLPAKDLQIVNCEEYNEYSSNAALQYANLVVSALNKEGDILTATERIGINDVTW